uniref:SRCR domain-containing protein n=1 Tax=Dromaius novaehollandiae TaxID=8790 RepID=A0A8C4JIV4_DRONO
MTTHDLLSGLPRDTSGGTPPGQPSRTRGACGTSNADAVELRLVNGGGPCAGRVEVKLRGQWGTVADGAWDMEDAEVVCQQLGCGSAKSAHAWSHFGKGSGPIHLVRVDCHGDESALWECTVPGWGPYTGPHDWDVGVVCQGFVQLVGGDSACSGRVEVRQGRGWATLCKAHVDLNAAHVICKELGCGAALAVTGAAHFGAGAGPIWDGSFKCAGNESLLSACARRLPHGQGCTHSSDAGIICSPYTGFRLANGSTECTGRVELEARGTWGSLCDAGWDMPDAQVLCHHLGCGFAASVPRGGYFGTGSGPLWRDTFHCSGTESHLGECPATALGTPACSPRHAAAVNCSGACGARLAQCNATLPSPAPPGHTAEAAVVCSGDRQVRLASGPGRCTGRVEVYMQGAWSRVCEDAWDLWDAAVVCRQLGCGEAMAAPGSAGYSQGSGPVWLGAGDCSGTEATLWDCPAPVRGQRGCKQGASATAVCSELTVLRLAGDSRCAGRLEVFYNGTWGSVCANGTSPATAAVVCQQLGCGATGRLASAPATTQGSGPAWLAWVQCGLGDDSLWHCPSAPWQLQPCDSPGDTHITCDGDPGDGTACTGSSAHAGQCSGPGTLQLWPAQPSGGGAALARRPQLPGHCHPSASCRGWPPGTEVPSLASLSHQPLPCIAPCAHSDAGRGRIPRLPRALLHVDVLAGAHRSHVAGAGAMPVPTILCIVLGILLCLAVGALAVQAWRTAARMAALMFPAPCCPAQKDSSPALCLGSGQRLGTGGDPARAWQPLQAPAMLSPAGSWSSLSHLELSGAATDAPASAPGDARYDNVGVSSPGTSLLAWQGHAVAVPEDTHSAVGLCPHGATARTWRASSA